jgi:hypothetical protein
VLECHGVSGRRGQHAARHGHLNNDLTDPFWKYGGDWLDRAHRGATVAFGEMPAHPELNETQMRELVDYVLKLRGETR